MTNFQPQSPPPFGLSSERLLLLLPALGGLLLSVGLALAWLLPLGQTLQGLDRQRQERQRQRDQWPVALQRQTKARSDLERANQQQQQLLQLVAGTKQLDTLLAQLAVEAAGAGVALDSVEPQAAELSAAVPETKAGKAAPPAADPLLVPGLEKRSQLVIASGRFPELLAFLRRLESLSPLAVVSDLNLKPVESTKQGEPERTTLKFNLTAYSRAATRPEGPLPLASKHPLAN